jgi:hypothetical protein
MLPKEFLKRLFLEERFVHLLDSVKVEVFREVDSVKLEDLNPFR